MASDSNSTSDNVFQMMQTLLSVAPVPGLSAVAIVIQEIWKLVQNIALRQAECKQLVVYSATVVTTINNYQAKVGKSELATAVTRIQRIVDEIQDDLTKWKNYGRARGYLQNSEILDGIRKHREDLDKALAIVQLAHAIEQTEWNRRFDAARAADHQLLEEINKKQDDLNEKVQNLQNILTHGPPPAYQPGTTAQPGIMSPAQERAVNELYQLRSGPQDTGALPSRELLHEVVKMGQRAIHAGSNYDIWQGVWLSKFIVALKVYRDEDADQVPNQRDLERVNRQVDIWRTLRHPNVLQLYGICQLEATSHVPITFVSPWLPNRDVMRYLRAHPDADRLKLVQDIAKGLQYLHSVSVLHAGLQGSNVLVDADGNAAVSDFTLSKIIDFNVMMTRSNGSDSAMRWWAPEAQAGTNLSGASDVWSWAMTALEIFSEKMPYYTIKSVGHLILAIGNEPSLLPVRSEYSASSSLLQDDRLWTLLSSCWVKDPKQRPTMDDINEKLVAIRSH